MGDGVLGSSVGGPVQGSGSFFFFFAGAFFAGAFAGTGLSPAAARHASVKPRAAWPDPPYSGKGANEGQRGQAHSSAI